jgi:hypothetical protein
MLECYIGIDIKALVLARSKNCCGQRNENTAFVRTASELLDFIFDDHEIALFGSLSPIRKSSETYQTP